MANEIYLIIPDNLLHMGAEELFIHITDVITKSIKEDALRSHLAKKVDDVRKRGQLLVLIVDSFENYKLLNSYSEMLVSALRSIVFKYGKVQNE